MLRTDVTVTIIQPPLKQFQLSTPLKETNSPALR